MKKKQKANVQLFKSRPSPLVLIVLLLVAAQALSFYLIYQNKAYIIHDSERSIANLINTSEEKRYREPVIDAAENKVYIPEAQIYLPLNPTTRDLRYDYRKVSQKADLYLSLRGVVGNQISTDDPSCDKMVQITGEKNLSTPFSEIEPTNDGLRYIFKHDSKCSIYFGTTLDDLTEAAKQIKSY